MIKRHFHKRNLPHLYYNEGIYFITYRLSGSIPQSELKKLQIKMNNLSADEQLRIFNEYDKLLDVDFTRINYLSIPKVAEVCKQSIMFFDEKDVHVIIGICVCYNFYGDINRYGWR